MEQTTNRLTYTLFKKRAHSFNTRMNALFSSMSFTEKLLITIFGAALCVSTLFLSWSMYTNLSTVVPAHGGTHTEGIVGIPRFINPVLATSEVDKALTEVLYASLFTYDTDGNLIPELAERMEVVNDGTRYVVLLKDGLTFHDGTPLRAQDVAFTIEAIQDPFVRSPLRPNWNGVNTRVIDERTIEFNLPSAYPPFAHNLAIGILPEHLWGQEPLEQMPFNELNVRPVGSGPYRISLIENSRNRAGSHYTLSAFPDYSLGMPYITTLTIQTYETEQALWEAWEKGDMDASTDISYSNLSDINPEDISRLTSRKVFAVFFNQNENDPLRSTSLRKALIQAVDTENIVTSIFDGYAQTISSPMPFLGVQPERVSTDAYSLFEQAGWQTNEETGTIEGKDGETLSFTLHTSTAEELVEAADMLASQWGAYGIQVDLDVTQVSTLLETVIRPRAYEALLFGYVISYDNDLYGFWHSSGRNDPGLNTALYTNIAVDELLEKVRTTQNSEDRNALFGDINRRIVDDAPALFLFSPHIPYVSNTYIGGEKMKEVVSASDRFLTVHTWFLNTKRVWNTFVN